LNRLEKDEHDSFWDLHPGKRRGAVAGFGAASGRRGEGDRFRIAEEAGHFNRF